MVQSEWFHPSGSIRVVQPESANPSWPILGPRAPAAPSPPRRMLRLTPSPRQGGFGTGFDGRTSTGGSRGRDRQAHSAGLARSRGPAGGARFAEKCLRNGAQLGTSVPIQAVPGSRSWKRATTGTKWGVRAPIAPHRGLTCPAIFDFRSCSGVVPPSPRPTQHLPARVGIVGRPLPPAPRRRQSRHSSALAGQPSPARPAQRTPSDASRPTDPCT